MKRTALRRISDRQRARLAAYAKVRKAWLADFPECAVCLVRNVINDAVDVHHKRGRNGTLLADTRFLLSVCRFHHDKIHAHPKWARKWGWTSPAREWGVPVPL